jgi:hypothetical protein
MIKEEEKITGIGEHIIRRLVKEGKVNHFKSGKRAVIHYDSLITFLRQPIKQEE